MTTIGWNKNTIYTILKKLIDKKAILLYEGEIYGLGICFGGSGVMDIKVCDFNLTPRMHLADIVYQEGYYFFLNKMQYGAFLFKKRFVG